MYTIKMSARYLLVNIQSYSFTHNHISLGAHKKHRPLYAILLRRTLSLLNHAHIIVLTLDDC